MKALLSRMNEFYEQLSMRERRLLLLFVSTLLLGGLTLGGVQVWEELDTRAEHNQDLQKTLQLIKQKEASYLKNHAQLEALESKLGAAPLQLNGYIETLTKKYHIDPPPETNPKSPTAVGKKYRMQSIDVHFTKIGLQALLQLMQELEETAGHVVQVTQLSIHPRDDKHTEFRADMTVSTYELAPVTASPSEKNKTEEDSKKESS